MREYKHLFGPVPSRRFGRSLGVDLTPFKACTLDCVFCQLGRTSRQTTQRREYVPTRDVLAELEDWLARHGDADYVTLSGSGEPTLHSRFGDVVSFVRERSDIPVLILTNGTTLHLPEVRAAARQANVVKVSLSAWDEDSFRRINRPAPGVRFADLVEGEKAFRAELAGQLWMEVFVLWGINSIPADVRRIAAIASTIRPDRIQLNTAVRPPAEEFAVPLASDRLEPLAKLFTPRAEVIAEFSADHSPQVEANEKTILAMLMRRPCTAIQIADVFGMHVNEVSKIVGKLTRQGTIGIEKRKGAAYFVPRSRDDRGGQGRAGGDSP